MFRKALRPILKPIIGLSKRDIGQDVIRRRRLLPSVKRISRSQVKTVEAQLPLVWQMDQPEESVDESYQDLRGLLRERPQPDEPHPASTHSLSALEPREPTIKRTQALEQRKPQMVRSEISEDFPVKKADEPSVPTKVEETVGDVEKGNAFETYLTPTPNESRIPPEADHGVSMQNIGKPKARKVVSPPEKSPSAITIKKPTRSKPKQKQPKPVRGEATPKLVARQSSTETSEIPKEAERETSIKHGQPTQKEGPVLLPRAPKEPKPIDVQPRRVVHKPTKMKEQPDKPVREVVVGKFTPVMRKPDPKEEGEPKPSPTKSAPRKVEQPYPEGETGDLHLILEVPSQPKEKPVRGRRPPFRVEQKIVRPIVHRVIQRTPAPSAEADVLDPDELWTRPTTRELTLVKPPSPPSQVDRREQSADGTHFPVDQPVRTTLARHSEPIQRSPIGEAEPNTLVARAGEEATSQSSTEAGETKPEVDVEAVAKEVYAILKRKLKIEQERIRGWGGFR